MQMFAVSGTIPTLGPSEYNETVATQAAAYVAAMREAAPSPVTIATSGSFQVETTVYPPEPMDVDS